MGIQRKPYTFPPLGPSRSAKETVQKPHTQRAVRVNPMIVAAGLVSRILSATLLLRDAHSSGPPDPDFLDDLLLTEGSKSSLTR